jgi:2-dehydro-3-deoxyphosphogluconate aldolase/(4S)-4-hydroxy-2-oxoglutarate aldolase
MRSKEQITRALENPGVIAVIRAKSPEQVLPLAESLLQGGIIAIEITMTTPNAIEAIRDASAKFAERALIGVGTVLDPETARAAVAAGAQFVVTPVTRPEIVAAVREARRDVPVMLGAYSPTEAQLAHQSGADYIKIFPADTLGPAYIKAIRAPLPHLKIVPTGGVDLKTIGGFFKAGCVAVGVGSSLLDPRLIEEKNWGELTRRAAEFVAAAMAARSA